MAIFSKNQFEELAKIQNEDSTSIYIPTLRSGDNEKAKIMLKNQIQSLKKHLKSMEKGEKHISNYVEPLTGLLDDHDFWRHLSDGLALFRTMEIFENYVLPVHFEEYFYFGDSFYLTPLTPFFSDNGSFYILAISQRKTRLFEGSRDAIGPIEIEGKIPGSIEDSVGYDFKQKSLQYRSEQTSAGDVQYHGHGAGKDDKNAETDRFLRDIDKGFTAIAGKNGKPLIIASVDELFARFKKICSYDNLYDKNISGNQDDTGMFMLHEKAWDLLKDIFTADRQEAMNQLQRNRNNDRTSTDIRKIISESVAGNVDTLFVALNSHIWGRYNESTLEISLDDQHYPGNECLIDRACKETMLQSGRVFLEKKDNLPLDGSPVNAYFRF